MDHIEAIRCMSVRRLAGLALAVVGTGGLLVIGGLYLWLGGAGGGLAYCIAAGLFALLTCLAWVQFDRLLSAREFAKDILPARPEFYDFDKLNTPMHVDEVGGKALKDLTFVVFDTETTGLSPTGGDEIISIAGVRVKDGRLSENEPFSRLVDPGMPIPKDSIRFHGITDAMVQGEAAIGPVIADFKAFVGEAVLVAHNAAFDMEFLAQSAEATGLRFDNLVLDTLLLSVFAEAESRNHSLDAIAERLGVNIEGRHTALGDSIATAKVFIRLLDLLEARGITTLRQAINASVKMEQVREMGKDW